MILGESEITALNTRFAEAAAADIVVWAVSRFPGRIALSASFSGDGGTVLCHMIAQAHPPVPVIFLDTGLLFAETYEFKRQLAERLGLTILEAIPKQTVEEQASARGPNLWERNPDLCCRERKVEPMRETLKDFDAWITGIRRNQTSGRSQAQVVSGDQEFGVIKICPLLNMTDQAIEEYLFIHALPSHPLKELGYASIGCRPCTTPVAVGEDARAGRWRGCGKTECGLHRANAA